MAILFFFSTSRLELQNCVLEGGIPFDKVHGANTFEVPAVNERFNEIFNKSMVHHSTIVIKEVLNHYHEFDNLKRVVDVGGGLGVTINMIVSKYPHIQGVNYDLPHVIKHAPFYPGMLICYLFFYIGLAKPIILWDRMGFRYPS